MNRTQHTAEHAARHTAAARLVVETPIGPLVVRADGAAVAEVLLPNTGAAGGAVRPDRCPAVLREAARQLEQYFGGRRRAFDVPLRPEGTPFQVAVWTALNDIPYGETITYAELARRVGRPTAHRAAGQANGANPLAIVVPCHRVVAAGGRIGGYAGGITVKRRLLALEGLDADGWR